MSWFTEALVCVAAILYIGDNLLTSLHQFREEQK